MTSCAEAKYHLNECGESRLDLDGDCVPCQNVCR
nr:MAG TPA: Choline binding protein [Caudoviricetes sp.]